MWSMTGGAAQHIQFAHVLPAGMVFAAQGGAAQPEGSLSVQVAEAVLPVSPIPASPDDVVMSESGQAIIRSDARRSLSRSTKSRSGRSHYSAMSGASQVALNAMRSTQDMLARMESKQDTTQDQLNQRVDQAFQAIRMLAARPGVFKSATFPKVEVPTAPVHVSTGVVEAVSNDAASHEVVRALKAAETRFEERWRQREAEAEKAKESWATNLQKSLNDQWESTSGSRVKSRQTEAKSTGVARSEDKELPKKELREKPSRQDEDPSEPSSSGASSEEEDSSSDSSGSSDGMPSYATMVTNAKGGNMLTLRTFTNTLDDFDEKQSLTARRRWWEKFLNMTIQAGWTEQMKIYEFKTKMSPAARNWMGQLGKRVRTNWGRLAREFKREYCKSRVSDSEKYYTMKQYKDETALAFLYRLNLAAERADVKFRKSERRREQHIKRFIKNLTDMSLKSTLQSQRFYKVSDLEYVLKQQKEVNASGGYSTRSPPNRDFRADNVARGGMRQLNLYGSG
ncbi:hypothetical protein PHMEG_00034053, partial [Phytophthora megakarya]